MPKLVSMARTKAEIKAQKDRYKTAMPSDGPPYPHGLTIRLESESLKKLGVKLSDLSIGDTVRIVAECEVSELRQNNTKTNSEACVELQIEKMAFGQKSMADAIEDGIDEADDE